MQSRRATAYICFFFFAWAFYIFFVSTLFPGGAAAQTQCLSSKLPLWMSLDDQVKKTTIRSCFCLVPCRSIHVTLLRLAACSGMVRQSGRVWKHTNLFCAMSIHIGYSINLCFAAASRRYPKSHGRHVRNHIDEKKIVRHPLILLLLQTGADELREAYRRRLETMMRDLTDLSRAVAIMQVRGRGKEKEKHTRSKDSLHQP